MSSRFGRKRNSMRPPSVCKSALIPIAPKHVVFPPAQLTLWWHCQGIDTASANYDDTQIVSLPYAGFFGGTEHWWLYSNGPTLAIVINFTPGTEVGVFVQSQNPASGGTWSQLSLDAPGRQLLPFDSGLVPMSLPPSSASGQARAMV